MNDITPEDLVLVAEAMGHESVVIAKDTTRPRVMKLSIDSNEGRFKRDEYNPLNNDSQCMELMEKFKIFLEPPTETLDWWATTGTHGAYGKSINEAVTRAMIARVKNEP